MATTYYADNYISEPMEGCSANGITMSRVVVFTIGTAFVINDVVRLCPLDGVMFPGFTLLGFTLEIPDNDSGTSEVLEIGDSTAANRFVTTTNMGTIGQVAGRVNYWSPAVAGSGTVNAGGTLGVLPLGYTTADYLAITVATAPGTGTTGGKIKGVVQYTQLANLPV